MVLFLLFLGFVFVVWRFAAYFVFGNSSWPSSRKVKYFVLRGQSRGEILEVSVGERHLSDRITLRSPGSGDNSRAEYLLSDIQLISEEVAELLSAITCRAERLGVLADSERFETSRTEIVNGSRVLVKLGSAENEIPGVVLYKGPVDCVSGTLFSVQLKKEDHGVDTERTVLFKGKTYFRQRNDPSVLVSRDRRVLVPISKLRLRPGDHRALRTTENIPTTRDPDSTSTEREPQTAAVNVKENSTNPIKKRTQLFEDAGHVDITEARTLPGIRRRKQKVREESPAVGRNSPEPSPEPSQVAAITREPRREPLNPLDTAPGLTASEGQSARRRLPKRPSDPVRVTIPEKEEDYVVVPRVRRKHLSDSSDYRSSLDDIPRPRTERGTERSAARSLDFSLSELSLGLPPPMIPEPAVDRRVDQVLYVRPSETPAAEGRRPLELDQRVVAFDSRERMLRGSVRYISNQKDERGNIILGIELDEPQGLGNGTRSGVRHFTCLKDHALFVPIGAALSEDDFEGRPPTTKSTETHPPSEPDLDVFGSLRALFVDYTEDSPEKTPEDREDFLPVRPGLAHGLVSQKHSADALIETLKQCCSIKDIKLLELRAELRETNAAKETLERELREARETFERERINLLRLNPPAVDWTIQRDEVHVTEQCLGKGAWATVNVGLFRGTKVAVKRIHDLILSDYNRELFKREMQMASRCRHPCLLQFIGATTDDGPALLVTELLDTSLRSLLNQRSLTEEEIISIALDVSRGLNYLHLSDPSPIIHRDVSSANVLLWRGGDCWRAKLSDYGTANFMRRCGTANPGAPLYVAPEAQQVKEQSPKMDVYSFGMLLCEMCIRQLPSLQGQLAQIDRVPNSRLKSVVTSCVCTDAKRRPAMSDVLREVEKLGPR